MFYASDVTREAKLRAAVEAYIRSAHDGNNAAAARQLGLRQPHLHKWLAGQTGTGLRLIEALAPHVPAAVAAYLGMSRTTAAAELPNLDEAADLVGYRYGPAVQGFANVLRQHFSIDQPFQFWVDVLNRFAQAQAAQEGTRSTERDSA